LKDILGLLDNDTGVPGNKIVIQLSVRIGSIVRSALSGNAMIKGCHVSLREAAQKPSLVVAPFPPSSGVSRKAPPDFGLQPESRIVRGHPDQSPCTPHRATERIDDVHAFAQLK
jgi:hypothetical protein